MPMIKERRSASFSRAGAKLNLGHFLSSPATLPMYYYIGTDGLRLDIVLYVEMHRPPNPYKTTKVCG